MTFSPAKPLWCPAIPLDPHLARRLPQDELDFSIRRLVGSTRYEVDADRTSFVLLGPDTYYHAIDPDLPSLLDQFRPGLDMAGIAAFTCSSPDFDLSFEDSWSGRHLARFLRLAPADSPLVVIHLDDHTDMMPPLLGSRDGTLVFPGSDDTFDATSEANWLRAITSGCVGIGSFLSPLFHSDHPVHVRHVDNCMTPLGPVRHVAPGIRLPDLFAGFPLAALAYHDHPMPAAAGTYMAGTDPALVLRDLPRGTVVVHIDFDYFINDFNGNLLAGRGATVDEATMIEAADRKLARFLEAMRRYDIRPKRWLVATSPGFCAIRHWNDLLEKLSSAFRSQS